MKYNKNKIQKYIMKIYNIFDRYNRNGLYNILFLSN